LGWNITDVKELEDAIFEMKLELARKTGAQEGMTVVDVGCGQGGFTAALAKAVWKTGKVFAVDVSDEYLTEFTGRLDEYGVSSIVTFIREDAANIERIISNEVADIVASYRLLEELKQPKDMDKIVREMVRIVKKGGRVCITELSTQTQNEAEETYVNLHRESGDSLFEPHRILEAMGEAGLSEIRMEKLETNIWFSPELARQNLEFAQVWFDEDVRRTLGSEIDEYGMKHPALLMFSGMRK
jgi:ubiquinone/menaquinone biosynthesis C-methylase UbiE